ncbi:protein TsetseEP isoform X2 [Rhipicephalus sanguineus]|uniref:protein TsetseEP isoform X2 n=1 Tax=Rhipicephalus sanguineus TaxID=34632 RepID=UPI001895C9CE|nr:protein TsetseEP isoform X2 [Rhipicephalus sanguineus]
MKSLSVIAIALVLVGQCWGAEKPDPEENSKENRVIYPNPWIPLPWPNIPRPWVRPWPQPEPLPWPKPWPRPEPMDHIVKDLPKVEVSSEEQPTTKERGLYFLLPKPWPRPWPNPRPGPFPRPWV